MMSSSDAYSPQKLGREANLFDTELSYDGLFNAVKKGKGFMGTYEFFPEEGKYSFDGHRKCDVSLAPIETMKYKDICPQCGKLLTIGVMHRVEKLADRKISQRPVKAADFHYIIPLPEILSELYNAGVESKKVTTAFIDCISYFGNEFSLLKESSVEDIKRYNPLLAEAIHRMRTGRVLRTAGYDGVYGVIKLFNEKELKKPVEQQLSIF